jgi:hypothetical protein
MEIPVDAFKRLGETRDPTEHEPDFGIPFRAPPLHSAAHDQ